MAEYNRVIDYIIEQADRYDIKNLQFEEDIKFNLGRTTDNYYSRIVGKVLTDITSVLTMQKLMISIENVMRDYVSACKKILLDASDEYYIVSISAKEGHEELSEDAFDNEILYQTVKHEVYTQTKDIRSLIMARAMASTVIEKTVTYEPKNEDASTSEIDTMSILTNWFDKND